MSPAHAPEIYARLLHDREGRPLGYVMAPAGELRTGPGAPSVLLLRGPQQRTPARGVPAARPATVRRREAS